MKILNLKTSAKFRACLLIALGLLLNYTNSNAQKNTKAEPIFNQTEKQAEFPGGIDQFYKYLAHNVRYPAMAREHKVQGKVFITFVVEKDGTLSDLKILRGIGSGCDEETIRVFKNSPKWIPAKQNGRIVRSQFTVPVSFQLS